MTTEIIFENGTINIPIFGMIGDLYVTKREITMDMFPEDLLNVTFITDGEEIIHPHMRMATVFKMDDMPGDMWAFGLENISDEALSYAKLQSRIDYLGMMTDVEFE